MRKALFVVAALLLAPALDASPGVTERGAPGVVRAKDDAPELARRGRGGKKRGGRKKASSSKKVEPRQGTTTSPEPAPTKAGDVAPQSGPSRVEFDERLIRGQTNQADAIYLFQRRESALRSLIKKRRSFHREIDEALLE